MNYSFYTIPKNKPKDKFDLLIATEIEKDIDKPVSYVFLSHKEGEKRLSTKYKLVPVPIIKSDEQNLVCLFVSGPSGSGKSFFSGQQVLQLLKTKRFKHSPIYLISAQDATDKAFDSFQYYKVNITSPDFQKLTWKDFKDSIVIFDDINAISDKNLSKMIIALQLGLVQNSRKNGNAIINISHSSKDYMKTKYLNEESSYATIFPSANWNDCKLYLKDKLGFDQEQLAYAKGLKTRALTIHKACPNYIISDHEIVLL